jgi:hypothetical protein
MTADEREWDWSMILKKSDELVPVVGGILHQPRSTLRVVVMGFGFELGCASFVREHDHTSIKHRCLPPFTRTSRV